MEYYLVQLSSVYFMIDRNHVGCNGWSELREDVGRILYLFNGKTSILTANLPSHTSFEESSRAKKFYITFDTDFWRYLPSGSKKS